ncbi:MAG TPA: F0F1 ATP synthase subunit epsilon [Candidatus Paceibacterota bacterium]|nr:F0F1 ATP synthase subunit epsilon [Candidatus Paceibacterota bacterium]
MTVSVYSIEKVLFRGDAVAVNCNTQAGEITILSHHRPIISILAKGTVKITDGAGREHWIPVRSGFLEVNSQDQAMLLVEEGHADA